MNYWDELMGSTEDASVYMQSYGEGVGSETRATISKFINDNESVLDVGCGPGWNYEHFRDVEGLKLTDYKGTDYSELMIEGALLKYPEAKFEVADARDMGEGNNTWDVVLLQDIVEHTNGYKLPVKEALRIARKRVIVVFWRLTDGEEDTINDDGNDGYGAAYSRPKWEKYLDSLNLKWMTLTSEDGANRHHDFYFIEKGEE